VGICEGSLLTEAKEAICIDPSMSFAFATGLWVLPRIFTRYPGSSRAKLILRPEEVESLAPQVLATYMSQTVPRTGNIDVYYGWWFENDYFEFRFAT
jgi:hypothetical protein